MLLMTHPAPNAPWTPASIIGMQAWLKPESLSGLSDGAAVGSWADSSGAGHTVTQANAVRKPLYRASGGSNNMPYVEFDGVDDILGATFTLGYPMTMFLVLKQITWTNTDKVIDGGVNSTMMLRQAPATPSLRVATDGTGNATSSTLAVGSWGLVKVVWDTTAKIAISNGADNTGSITFTAAPNGVSVGASAGSGNAANIALSELLLYNTALGSSDITAVKNYINTRFTLW